MQLIQTIDQYNADMTAGGRLIRALQILQAFAVPSLFSRLLRIHLRKLNAVQLGNQFRPVQELVQHFCALDTSLNRVYTMLAGRRNLDNLAKETVLERQVIFRAAGFLEAFANRQVGERRTLGQSVANTWKAIGRIIAAPYSAAGDFRSIALLMYNTYGSGAIHISPQGLIAGVHSLATVTTIFDRLQSGLSGRAPLAQRVDLDCLAAADELWLAVILLLQDAAVVTGKHAQMSIMSTVRQLLELSYRLLEVGSVTGRNTWIHDDERWTRIQLDLVWCRDESTFVSAVPSSVEESLERVTALIDGMLENIRSPQAQDLIKLPVLNSIING